MKRLLPLILVLLLILTSCRADIPEKETEAPDVTASEITEEAAEQEPTEETEPETEAKKEDDVDRQIKKMSLEEKIGQMFMVTPEALVGTCEKAELNGEASENAVTAFGSELKEAMEKYRPGGVIMFYQNLTSPEQIKEFNSQLQSHSDIPLFIGIDEEGGRVARIGNNENFPEQNVGAMADIGASGSSINAYEVGKTIGAYLKGYGFNLDFAPDADVNSNPDNTVIGDRSFGSDPELVADMVTAAQNGFLVSGTFSCVKHYPGHGDTSADTHDGFVSVSKTWDQLLETELIPFKAAIENGTQFIMASHITCPEITGDEYPATLSYTLLTEKLRGELGYDGIIITDGMNMGAITDNYSSSEAAVLAAAAGVDIILMPYDLDAAYNGLLEKVQKGVISEERIDQSVRRILLLKDKYL